MTGTDMHQNMHRKGQETQASSRLSNPPAVLLDRLNALRDSTLVAPRPVVLSAPALQHVCTVWQTTLERTLQLDPPAALQMRRGVRGSRLHPTDSTYAGKPFVFGLRDIEH
jgi:hypothetical protein